MYYPASATIAGEHPDLADEVRALDAYLAANRGEVIRPARAADVLDIVEAHVEARRSERFAEPVPLRWMVG